jgi:hypothetical protein
VNADWPVHPLASKCFPVAELWRHAGVDQSVQTGRVASADGSLMIITGVPLDVVWAIVVLVISGRCEADRRLRINYPWGGSFGGRFRIKFPCGPDASVAPGSQ